MNPTVSPYIIAENEQARAAEYIHEVLDVHQFTQTLLYLGSVRDGSRYAFVLPESPASSINLDLTSNEHARKALVTIYHSRDRYLRRFNRIRLNGFLAVENIGGAGLLHRYVLGAGLPLAFTHDLRNLLSGLIPGH